MSDNGKTSIVFDHTLRYYESLREDATVEEMHGVDVLVFRGSVVRVFRGLGVSQSYYSKIRKALIDMGCVTLISTGGRTVPSVLVLHRAPTWEDWQNLSSGSLTPQLDVAIMAQRLADVTNLIGGINVKQAIADLALRLESLEREVERIGKTPTARRRQF